MRPHTPFKLTDSLENRLVSSLLSACVIAFCLNGTLPAEETETARQGDEWHMVHLQGKAAGDGGVYRGREGSLVHQVG